GLVLARAEPRSGRATAVGTLRSPERSSADGRRLARLALLRVGRQGVNAALPAGLRGRARGRARLRGRRLSNTGGDAGLRFPVGRAARCALVRRACGVPPRTLARRSCIAPPEVRILPLRR